jgi:hypothetical protein
MNSAGSFGRTRIELITRKMGQIAALAEPVYRGIADAEPLRELGHPEPGA